MLCKEIGTKFKALHFIFEGSNSQKEMKDERIVLLDDTTYS